VKNPENPFPCRSKTHFSSPKRPDQLWGQPASHSIGTGSSFVGAGTAATV